MIYNSLAELIGNTPLVDISRFAKAAHAPAQILAKMECFNPCSSIKDRVAIQMIEAAERDGRLKPGGTIVEPTSGNTGIGLAAVAAAKGYRCIIIMTDTMSIERRKLITQLGAELVLMPGAQGMKGCIAKAEEIVASLPNSVLLMQFSNPNNPKAHFMSTGPEIVRDTEGKLDFFIAGAGTGGTITGVGRYLKEHVPQAKLVVVEPAKSPVFSGGEHSPHGIQGIGAGFIPDNLDLTLVDMIEQATDEEAYYYAQLLGSTEGALVGISSGAALAVAVKLAQRPENHGKRFVVILPDTGERYLSTPLFDKAK